jgi:hypothetical protein
MFSATADLSVGDYWKKGDTKKEALVAVYSQRGKKMLGLCSELQRRAVDEKALFQSQGRGYLLKMKIRPRFHVLMLLIKMIGWCNVCKGGERFARKMRSFILQHLTAGLQP